MDSADMHRLIGELTAEMRGVRASIDSLHNDFQCVPERLTALELWKDESEERRKRLAGAKVAVGGSIVLLAVTQAWEWMKALIVGHR